MEKRMSTEELAERFDRAIDEGHIYALYQPQINHATGRMIGAEALMRWKDPEYGMQYPADFIPALEEKGLIYRADLYLFEQICRFQRKIMESGLNPVPISFNISRFDIYEHDYVTVIEEIRNRVNVPVRLLRAEITESFAIGGMELVEDLLSKLHEAGYVVEMDDFGSGYSSLNILKDLSVDVIKLDMRFMSGNVGGRGGIIISSMVQMTKWLRTPVIAEGVETMEQADYMKSIGCNYIQGYLYSKPISDEEFTKELDRLDHEPMAAAMKLVDTMNAGKFWSPESLETLIFSNFVGGAAIFTYENGKAEILRVNPKYIKEIGMNMNAHDFIDKNPWRNLGIEGKRAYEFAIKKAIKSNEEETVETWRTFESRCCGEEKICIRSNIRVIGRAGEQYLIYAMIQNITAEKKRYIDLFDSERRFRFASEQANVYAWEFDFRTREMRPCFRCMRDLHLPPVIRNYPEPVFDDGVFPEDYREMYYKMLSDLENGAESAEAVIPLTVGRVPFHVRYTTEFDENGKPLKAYGSATLVVDNAEEE